MSKIKCPNPTCKGHLVEQHEKPDERTSRVKLRCPSCGYNTPYYITVSNYLSIVDVDKENLKGLKL